MSIKASMNALKTMNEKLYPKLSADERFKMVIKTFVNGDEVQRQKLVNSCPKVNYFESDHAYTERIEVSRDLVTTFIIQLLEYDKTISMMKIMKGLNCKELGLNVEMKIVNEVKAFFIAFEVFCDEYLGTASKDMIQAWYGYDERYINKINEIKEFINLYEVGVDTVLKDIWLRKVFINGWEQRVNPPTI